jgi:hypothetical protein
MYNLSANHILYPFSKSFKALTDSNQCGSAEQGLGLAHKKGSTFFRSGLWILNPATAYSILARLGLEELRPEGREIEEQISDCRLESLRNEATV